jgi:hypothetical protein
MTTLTTYPLRLPKSITAAAEELSKVDGTSLNQFVATAVAEKIAVMKTTAFFEERRQRATGAALDQLLSRTSGEAPREGDELPDGWVPLKTRAAMPRKASNPAALPTTRPRRAPKKDA